MRFDIPTDISFNTVLIDPPWPHDEKQNARRPLHYDRMSEEHLRELPISEISSDDAHLWLWTTTTHMELAFELVKSWGFHYKTMATWRKTKLGMGWWLRSRFEHMILAVKSNNLRQNPGSISTELVGKWRGHSVKPEEQYDFIESVSPGPYLELFVRDSQERENWLRLGSPGVPAEAYNLTQRLTEPVAWNDGKVRGVGGLEIKPGHNYVYLQRTIEEVPVTAISQKNRKVVIEINGARKTVSIDKLRAS